MKTKKPLLEVLALVTSALVGGCLNPRTHIAPTITTQPSSRVVLPGAKVTFNVAVKGTGPFTYQWQFNGTKIANDLIATVAGNGVASFSGDGSAATNAGLNPTGLAFDASGNLYISDTGNHRIRKVDSRGIITTVVGNGVAGFSGDGGQAANSRLHYPGAMAFDASGNLYIADWQNQRIRKVDTHGIITTVAGNGGTNYAGDGDAATNVSLSFPEGVAVNAADNLYIADSGKNRIWMVGTNGIITTVVGVGSGGGGEAGLRVFEMPAVGGYVGDGDAATNVPLHENLGGVYRENLGEVDRVYLDKQGTA